MNKRKEIEKNTSIGIKIELIRISTISSYDEAKSRRHHRLEDGRERTV
jgi:hypothetical protein